MDCMKESSFFVIKTGVFPFGEEEFEILEHKIFRIAKFFNIRPLPDQYKIKVHFLSHLEMENNQNSNKISIQTDAIAYTFCTNEIFILKYEEVNKKNSKNEYISTFIHEMVHIFQSYFSKIPPNKCVWLYESVACFLANQNKKTLDLTPISWENFINNFYKFADCYKIAYKFGEKIFHNNSYDAILNILKNPFDNIEHLKKLYIQDKICTNNIDNLLKNEGICCLQSSYVFNKHSL